MEMNARENPRPTTILVAEDDRDMRELVARALRRDGHRVLEVQNGAHLAEYLGEWPHERVDVIVSDIRMPCCTGLEFLKGLRDVDPRTPVILMTAFGDESTHAHAEELGAVLFDKPFDLDDLRTAVLFLLRGPTSRA